MNSKFLFLLLLVLAAALSAQTEIHIIKVSGENIIGDKGVSSGIAEGTKVNIVRKYTFGSSVIGQATILLVRGEKCAAKLDKLEKDKIIEPLRDVMIPLLDQEYAIPKNQRTGTEKYSFGFSGQAPKGLFGLYGMLGRVFIEFKTNGYKDWQHNRYYDIISEQTAKNYYHDSQWGVEYTWTCIDAGFFLSISGRDGLYLGAGICKEKTYIGFYDRTHILANDGKYLVEGDEKEKMNYIIGATFGKEKGTMQFLIGYNHVPQGVVLGCALVI